MCLDVEQVVIRWMILIIMTNLQADLGLGNPSYLLWADWFNLLQATTP